MSNGGEFEADFENTMRSKAALDAVRAFKQYHELVKSGWSVDKAFLLAFMGVYLLDMQEVKPLPRPDPPYVSAQSIYNALEKTQHHIKAEMAFLKKHM